MQIPQSKRLRGPEVWKAMKLFSLFCLFIFSTLGGG